MYGAELAVAHSARHGDLDARGDGNCGAASLRLAEISRLKRKAEVEVRIVSIPGDWFPPVPGTFIKETMNNLVDLGEKMGADPASWSTEPPQF